MNTVSNQNIQNVINGLIVDAHRMPNKAHHIYAMISCIKNATLPNVPAEKVTFWRNRYVELRQKVYGQPEQKPVEQAKPEHKRGYDPKAGIQHTDACVILRLLDRSKAEATKHPKMAAYLIRKAATFYLRMKYSDNQEVTSKKIAEVTEFLKNIPLDQVSNALPKFDTVIRSELSLMAQTCTCKSFTKEKATA